MCTMTITYYNIVYIYRYTHTVGVHYSRVRARVRDFLLFFLNLRTILYIIVHNIVVMYLEKNVVRIRGERTGV